jgi:hypothetical protein
LASLKLLPDWSVPSNKGALSPILNSLGPCAEAEEIKKDDVNSNNSKKNDAMIVDFITSIISCC